MLTPYTWNARFLSSPVPGHITAGPMNMMIVWPSVVSEGLVHGIPPNRVIEGSIPWIPANAIGGRVSGVGAREIAESISAVSVRRAIASAGVHANGPFFPSTGAALHPSVVSREASQSL